MLSVDYAIRILKQELVSELDISAIKDILSYNPLGKTDSISVDGAALSSRRANPIPGGLVPGSTYEANLQQSSALQTLV